MPATGGSYQLTVEAQIQTRANNEQLLTDFGQAASQMSRIIEEAMQGIGERIASSIMGGFRKGLDQIQQVPGTSGFRTAPGSPLVLPGELAHERSQQIALAQKQGEVIGQPGPAPIAPMPQLDPLRTPHLAAQAALQQQRITSQDPATQAVLKGIYQFEEPTVNQQFAQRAQADFYTSQMQVVRDMQRLGLRGGLTPEERERFGGAAQTGRAEIIDIAEQIGELETVMRESTRQILELTQALRSSTTEEEKKGIREQIKERRETAREAAEQAGALREQERGLAGRVEEAQGMLGGEGALNLRRFGRGLMIGAPIAAALAQVPGQFRAGAVGAAEVENLSGRAFMRGDLERAIAIQRAGGQEAVQQQAFLEALGGVGANIGLAAGSAALMAAPVPGAAQWAGAAGLTTFGARAVGGIAGFGREQQQAAESIISRQIGENAEFYDISRRGREFAVEQFQTARQMGAPELARFLAGAGRAPEFGPMPADAMGAIGARGERVSMLEFGRQVGMSPEQTMQMMQTLGRQAGVFETEGGAPRIAGMQPQIAQLLAQQGMGATAAPEFAAAMMRGGVQTREGMRDSLEASRDIISELIASGFDKASINRTLMVIAQQGQGLGQAGVARAEAERTMIMAERLFPGQTITDPQAEFAQRAMRGFLGATQGGGGLGAAAGFQAARGSMEQVRQRLGLRTDVGDELLAQQFGVSAGGLRAMAERQGVEWTPERQRAAQQIEREHQVRQLQSLRRMIGTGGEAAARVWAAQMGGAQTPEEAQRALTGLEAAGRPGDIFGPFPAPTAARVQERMAGVPGFGETQAMTAADVAKVTGGLSTLGSNLEAINAAMKDFVAKINATAQYEMAAPARQKQFEQKFAPKNMAMPRGAKY